MPTKTRAPRLAALFLVLFAFLARSGPAAQAAGGAAPVQASAGLFAEGERLFREDRPREAAAALEGAVLEPGADERAWLYLGLAYQQLGRHEDSVAVLRKGLPKASRYRHLFYFDIGNAFALQGKNAFAEEMYGEAILADGSYAPAYLNRANARMSQKNFRDASADYARYLALDPSSPQRATIEELQRRLAGALQAAESAAAAAEAARLAEEAAKKALLDQVAASLKAAADETTSLSAGTGSVQGYGDALELDD